MKPTVRPAVITRTCRSVPTSLKTGAPLPIPAAAAGSMQPDATDLVQRETNEPQKQACLRDGRGQIHRGVGERQPGSRADGPTLGQRAFGSVSEVESIRRNALDRAVGGMSQRVAWATEQIATLAETAKSQAVRLAALRSILVGTSRCSARGSLPGGRTTWFWTGSRPSTCCWKAAIS